MITIKVFIPRPKISTILWGRFRLTYNFVAGDVLTICVRHQLFRWNKTYNLLAVVVYDTKKYCRILNMFWIESFSKLKVPLHETFFLQLVTQQKTTAWRGKNICYTLQIISQLAKSRDLVYFSCNLQRNFSYRDMLHRWMLHVQFLPQLVSQRR